MVGGVRSFRRWWRATDWPEAVAGEWSRCAGGAAAGRGGESDVPARAEGGADVGAAVVSARVSGGNCSIRGATRRRRAVAVRLMVQNPRWAAECGSVGEIAVGGGALWTGAVRRWWRAGPWWGWQMGGIAALGVRHAGDTPWRCV